MKQIHKITFIFILLGMLSPLMGEDGMVLIPEGEFVMGSDAGYYDESPAHAVYLAAYWIDRYEVSNSEFALYVKKGALYETVEGAWFRYSLEGCLDAVGYFESKYECTFIDSDGSNRKWSSVVFALSDILERDRIKLESLSSESLMKIEGVAEIIEAQSKLPVRGVTWRDAQSFSTAMGKRLPTEAEWEKAARGNEGLIYPWGNQWNESNTTEPVAVDAGNKTISPYGCAGMAGNVWEWTADWYGEHYYAEMQDTRNPLGPIGLENGDLPGAYSDTEHLRSSVQGRSSDTRKVLRGGGFGGPENQARFNYRTSRRLWSNPNYWHADTGFRCAKDI